MFGNFTDKNYTQGKITNTLSLGISATMQSRIIVQFYIYIYKTEPEL